MYKFVYAVFVGAFFFTKLDAAYKNKSGIRSVFSSQKHKSDKPKKRLLGHPKKTPVFRDNNDDSKDSEVKRNPHFSTDS